MGWGCSRDLIERQLVIGTHLLDIVRKYDWKGISQDSKSR